MLNILSNMNPWIKAVLVAAVGGAIPAGLAALMDPAKFGIKFGNGHFLLIMLQGAAVAVGALFLKSPLGQKFIAEVEQAEQKAKEDVAMLEKVKGDIKASVTTSTPPAKS